jgi:hypothetical protein
MLNHLIPQSVLITLHVYLRLAKSVSLGLLYECHILPRFIIELYNFVTMCSEPMNFQIQNKFRSCNADYLLFDIFFIG